MVVRRTGWIAGVGAAALVVGSVLAASIGSGEDHASDLTEGTMLATNSPPGVPEPLASSLPQQQVRMAQGVVSECPYSTIMDPAEDSDRGFYFTRGRYSGGGSGISGSWATDFEKADRQFLVVLNRIMDIDAFPCENPVELDDPALRQFPFLYMVEVGNMSLGSSEVEGLREYLLAGGFLIVDDFWGEAEWGNFAWEIQQVLPDHEIVDIPLDHLIFRIVYPIEEILQVPCTCNTGGGPAFYGENGGDTPYLRGIFDKVTGRLMVVMSVNSDLGDAWEWAEDPSYPWDRSNYAFQLALNLITYAMTN